MNKYLIKFTIIIISVYFFTACAQTGGLTGGVKDTIPPLPIKFSPQFEQTNFVAKKVKIKFNEYFQLKDLNTQFIVSPPLKEKPKVKVKGKFLEIKILDTLNENTTYNFDFNDAVADFNENNILHGFQYVCSTGNKIDSLQISGTLLDAENLSPEENIFVFLYPQLNDTTPEKVLPAYLSKTNKEGRFSVRNVAEGSYFVFALKDQNTNLLYDQAIENIAFLKNKVSPTVKRILQTDTIYHDSIVFNKESKQNDTFRLQTIKSYELNKYTPDSLELYLFNEGKTNQYVSSEKRELPGKCIFKMNRAISSDFKISLIGHPNFSNFILEKKPKKDSLIYWIKDSAVYNIDTLDFIIRSQQMDSLKVWEIVNDTISLDFDFETLAEKAKKETKKAKGKGKRKSELQIKADNVLNNFLDKNKPIDLESNIPIDKINKKKIKLYVLPPDSAKKYLYGNRSDGKFHNSESTGITYGERLDKNTLFFILKNKKNGELKINPINFSLLQKSEQESENGDTIYIKLLKGNFALVDSLKFVAEYETKGLLGTIQPFADSMNLALNRSVFEVFGQKVDFSMESDTQNIKKYHLNFTGKNNESVYSLLVQATAFTDIFGHQPDSTTFEFKIHKDDYYSNLVLHLSNATVNTHFLLFDKNKKIIFSGKTTDLSTLNVTQLGPGTYKIRAFEDVNGNGKWDTGNFKKRIQPEKVFLYSKDLMLKSGWDTEEDWNLLKKPEKKIKKTR